MRLAIAFYSSIVLIFGIATILYVADPELYYRSAQEDRLLEWLTFWLFVATAALFLRNAIDDRRRRGGLPWFAAGLGLFCLLVGLEEISWGQRLFAYQPPDYFLDQNFQQEFNLHNVIDTKIRMLTLQAILVGYGVLLSIAAAIPVIGQTALRWRVVLPPLLLAPGFAAIATVYHWYPARFAGEWVEAAMGAAFLGVAVATRTQSVTTVPMRHFAVPVLIALLASFATLGVLRLQQGSDSDRIALTRSEIVALVADFESPRVHTRCNIHKRLFTFMREYNQPFLVRGTFAQQVRQAGDPTRADYLIDPWNSPYWVRHRCRGGEAVSFVYSFGPNRRRDSTDREIRGDDIGGYFAP